MGGAKRAGERDLQARRPCRAGVKDGATLFDVLS
jgi:hypothetical protein